MADQVGKFSPLAGEPSPSFPQLSHIIFIPRTVERDGLDPSLVACQYVVMVHKVDVERT